MSRETAASIPEGDAVHRYIRRGGTGILAGALAGAALAITMGSYAFGFVCGSILGAFYSLSMRSVRRGYGDNLMTAAAFGIPLWGLLSVIAGPLLAHRMPDWSAMGMRAHFPALVGWVLFCACLGVFNQVVTDLACAAWGPEAEPRLANPTPLVKKRIVILGGGFAGMMTAQSLEEELEKDVSVQITLISENNALLFTPMLAEVAGSSLEPSHISTPLRSSLRRTDFLRARTTGIDLSKRCVFLEQICSAEAVLESRVVGYDLLVLALGSVSNYLGLPNIEKQALNFKTLLDAIRVRNRVIEMFERADRDPDPVGRAPLLTFVIAGGGFAGVELVGALNDFARGILADYPNLGPHEVRVVLVHARDRILPELSESLARYAQEKMAERGVEFRLNARLADAKPGVVVLDDSEIRAETLVWTAGTTPSPVVKLLDVEKDKRGAVKVDASLAIPGHLGVWALGDCAAVTDAKSGQPCPPTAQFALREAKIVARNMVAHLRGNAPKTFHFDSLGALCVIGHQTACAELTIPFARTRVLQFSGLLAWVMWRGIYLAKLPGLERKIRVLFDWTVELFFPRDIVQTIDLK
jgi:NADH:ubiquinone reductase (H+-translocating)